MPDAAAARGAVSIERESQVVRVAIAGRAYVIRSPLDPAYVRGLAATVDGLMLQVRAHVPTADDATMAMLVAINQADELVRLRDELSHLKAAPAVQHPPAPGGRLRRLVRAWRQDAGA